MALPFVAVICLCVVAVTTAKTFDVVGWYVGTNVTAWPLEKLDWEAYSTIRAGSVDVNASGEAFSPQRDQHAARSARSADKRSAISGPVTVPLFPDCRRPLSLRRVPVWPPTGHVSCPKDPFFLELLAKARKHSKTVTLSSGPYPAVPYQGVPYTQGNAPFPTNGTAYRKTYIKTLGPAVRSCGAGIQGQG